MSMYNNCLEERASDHIPFQTDRASRDLVGIIAREGMSYLAPCDL